MELCSDPDTRPESEALLAAIWPTLIKEFKPALLGRMTVVPYFPLTSEEIGKIVRLQLGRVAERVAANYRARFSYDEAVIGAVASRCKEGDTGARAVDHLLNGTLLPELAAAFLGRLAEGQSVSSAHVGVDADGKFKFDLN
jgi:type VI secretion system protein VasG